MGERDVASRRRVLDAGALTALERGDERTRAFLSRPAHHVVPAPVLAQVWRDGARQARLARIVNDHSTTIDGLDEGSAKAVGVLLGRAGTSDVVDASVVLSARRHDALVFSADAADLRRIDPGLTIIEL
jgi:hypothetical protein